MRSIKAKQNKKQAMYASIYLIIFIDISTREEEREEEKRPILTHIDTIGEKRNENE
jgi:hypothetical protein